MNSSTASRSAFPLENKHFFYLINVGYHRMQLCSECRHVIKCPHCDLSLTFHRDANLLQCHLCSYTKPTPKSCPTVKNRRPSSLRDLAQSTSSVLSTPSSLKFALSAWTATHRRRKNSHEELFKQFRAPQSRCAHRHPNDRQGFHFPSVTPRRRPQPGCSPLHPRLSLSRTHLPAPHPGSRPCRPCRLPGEVIIQTFPARPSDPASGRRPKDYPAFYASAVEERRTFSYPPFCRLIKILFSDTDEQIALKKAESAHAFLLGRLPPRTPKSFPCPCRACKNEGFIPLSIHPQDA